MANESESTNGAEHNGSKKPRRFSDADYMLVVEVLAAGGTLTKAAKIVGFTRDTIYTYERKHPDKVDEYKKGMRAWCLRQIVEAARKGNWQASAWFLERVFPDEFALRVVNRTHLSGEITEKVHLVDIERLKQMHAAAAEVDAQKPRFSLS